MNNPFPKNELQGQAQIVSGLEAITTELQHIRLELSRIFEAMKFANRQNRE
jgi:hypothetical protein